MDKKSLINRRNVLKASGVAVVGGIGLTALTGGASAQVDGYIANGDYVETENGVVKSVIVTTGGTIEWDGFDNAPDTATLTLEGRAGQNKSEKSYTKLTEKTLNGLFSSKGERDFTLDSVDLVDAFGEGTFDSNTDGGEKNTPVDLRISVTVGSSDVTATGSDDMTVTTKNIESSAGIGGESNTNARSYDVAYYSHTEDVALYIDYGQDEVKFYVDASSWWGYPDATGWNHDQANINLGIDKDINGYGDFQLGYHVSDEAQYKPPNESGWGSKQSPPEGYSVEADEETGMFTLTVPRSELGTKYKFVVQGSAGGEYSSFEISTTEDKGWNADGGYDRGSKYYLEEDISVSTS